MSERILHHAPWLMDPSVTRIVYPVHNYRTLELADMILSSEAFLKPLPKKQIDLFEHYIAQHQQLPSNDSRFLFQKQNTLFYPATISENKGQLTFVKLLSSKLVKANNLTLVFAGNIFDQSYWNLVVSLLEAKGIPYVYKGFVSNRTELIDLYVQARALIHYSLILAPGPRVVYEALYGNTPFLISNVVQIDARIRSMGLAVERTPDDPIRESLDLNNKLRQLLHQEWGDKMLSFARKHMSDNVFDPLFEQIECMVYTKKLLEKF